MITDSFINEKAMIEPSYNAFTGIELPVMIGVFNFQVIQKLKNEGLIEQIAEKVNGNIDRYYEFYRFKDTNIGVYQNMVGAPVASSLLEAITHLFHTKKFIVYGSCGCLVDIPEGDLIIPTDAYRDEGVSYHYAKPQDYITIKNAGVLESFFQSKQIPFVSGKVWTTDAFFRETKTEVDRHIQEGCVCVDMECAALQAVCDYRGYEFYTFFYTADSLANTEWEGRILTGKETETHIGNINFEVALAFAKKLMEQ